jgi:predicted TIM-barrel fold metal-dependent hydrolase
MTIIDSDQHLVEHRGLWEEHIDPGSRGEAIRFTDDRAGNTWVTWRDRRLGLAEVQTPGDTASLGERHNRVRRGEPAPYRYDDELPRDHWDPVARLDRLADLGLDEAVLFPNYGLLWERTLSGTPEAMLANMRAWNRSCASVVHDGGGRLHPVAHLSLRDPAWLEAELCTLAAAGVRLGMIAPGIVDGKPLSHPDLDRGWAAFVEHGVTPVFHVADQTRPFDDAWYTDPDDAFVPTIDSVFLYTAAALACTDLIVNGVFERHPDLRLGIVELSAIWVPMFLLMLDGGVDFTSRLNGFRPAGLRLRPSEYFQRQVRVSSFSYELPERLRRQLGGVDLLMACSDYPHSEGTASPVTDYAATGKYGVDPSGAPGLFCDNAAFLLRR